MLNISKHEHSDIMAYLATALIFPRTQRRPKVYKIANIPAINIPRV
jgi:hypothetical protein